HHLRPGLPPAAGITASGRGVPGLRYRLDGTATNRHGRWYNRGKESLMRHLLVLLIVAVMGLTPGFASAEFENPKANIPPKAKPQRRNAGEGFPPLPLPATPLRRSEKKREPSPPALVGNITFSQQAARQAGLDWQTTIIDIEKWVQWTNQQLGQKYRFVGTD